MLAPILEELAKEYDGQIVVYKIDTEKEPELSAAFGIRSIPTLLFIPKSGDPQVAQGAMPKASLKKAIDARAESYMDEVHKIFPAASLGKDGRSVELEFEEV